MEKNDIIRLYEIYTKSHEEYAKIIWQFPTALVTLNVLALNYVDSKTAILTGLAVVNFAFLVFVFNRHVGNQRAIQKQLVKLEKVIFDGQEELGPQFPRKWFPKSTTIIFWVLFFCNIYIFFLGAGLSDWVIDKLRMSSLMVEPFWR